MAKGNVVPTITAAEHIGPDDTGDNIEAKRVANYQWDGSDWQRMSKDLTAGTDFDYIGVVATNATTDTLTYKLGGSGGTTIRVLVIGYAADASKVSDDITSLSFS